MKLNGIKSKARSVLLSTFLGLIPLGTLSQTLRILPLGNSITAGNMCVNGDIHTCVPLGGNKAVGYRLTLFNLLTAAGYDFDFVGTEQYGYDLIPDPDCAGFGGIRDAQLADIMESGTSDHTGYRTSGPYMNSNPADVVLLHIGTNDVLAADTESADIDRILNAIDDYEAAYNTPVMVFLARIISTRGASCGSDPGVVAYNSIIDDLAASRIADGDRLILVDMECDAGMDYENDFADQVHPNQDGYDKMGVAWFEAINAWLISLKPHYTLSMETPVGSGSVSPEVGTYSYLEGTEVQITAAAAEGFGFTAWSGDLESNSNPVDIIMDADKSITANFEKLSYALTVVTDGTEGAAVDPAGTVSVEHGSDTQIRVTQVPEGSLFDGWEISSGSGAITGDPGSTTTTVRLEAGDATVCANFVPVYHSLSVSVSGEGSVSVDPEQADYAHHASVRLTALPGEGYGLSRWTGDLEGSSNPVDVIMDADKHITATFEKLSYELTVITDGTEGAAIDPEGSFTVVHGEETVIRISQVPDKRFFDGWELILGSSVTIADPSAISTTVILEAGDATVRANFRDSTFVGFFRYPDADRSISVFPNPARDYIFLESKSGMKVTRVLVTDPGGRQVISQFPDPAGQDLKIDISHLLPGIYVLQLELYPGKIESEKFIKLE